jgi:hypothetical protein
VSVGPKYVGDKVDFSGLIGMDPHASAMPEYQGGVFAGPKYVGDKVDFSSLIGMDPHGMPMPEYAGGVFGGPKTYGSEFQNLLAASDPRNSGASAYTMPLPQIDSNWSPVSYVPGPGSQKSGTTVNIVNPVFRSPADAQAIVNLVRNQL